MSVVERPARQFDHTGPLEAQQSRISEAFQSLQIQEDIDGKLAQFAQALGHAVDLVERGRDDHAVNQMRAASRQQGVETALPVAFAETGPVGRIVVDSDHLRPVPPQARPASDQIPSALARAEDRHALAQPTGVGQPPKTTGKQQARPDQIDPTGGEEEQSPQA